jgi:cysteine synthase
MMQVGDTPLVPIALRIDGRARTVQLKLEGTNPCGSLKDRTAQSLIDDLERRGRLEPASILVESTSGNLGVALASLARRRGYRFDAVIDPKTTPENIARLRRLGARIELVDTPDAAGGYLLARRRSAPRSRAPGRQAVRRLVNPFGLAIEDLAIAPHVYQQAKASGRGTKIER